MKKLAYGLLTAVAMLTSVGVASAQEDCQRVNAAGSSGYVNVREFPSLRAPVITRLNNPSHGSDWGSAFWCGQEYWDGERTWSVIEFETKNGEYVRGWVSDKVLQFVD